MNTLIKDAKKDIQNIKNLVIRSKDGTIITVEDVCDIDIKHGSSFIKRENLNRYMVLSIDIKNRDIASFVDEANSIIKSLNIPSGYFLQWAGEFKNMNEATSKLKVIIPLSLTLIFLLLFSAFGSIKKALLIL